MKTGKSMRRTLERFNIYESFPLGIRFYHLPILSLAGSPKIASYFLQDFYWYSGLADMLDNIVRNTQNT